MKVTSKKCIPKWVPPEKRMRKYRKNMKDPSKVKWTKFMIVVPTQEDKEQLQACFEYLQKVLEYYYIISREYLHDSEIMDCPEDFIVLNQIAHCYLDEEREPGCVSLISVNPELYKNLYDKANQILQSK